MEYTLRDLVDFGMLQKLLDRLHDMLPLSSSVVDMQGTVAAACPGFPLCSEFHRKFPQSAAVCAESDADAVRKHAGRRDSLIYTCPFGLAGCVTPIFIGGRQVAMLHAGQVFLAPPDEARFREQARCYGYDEEKYLAAMREIPVFSRAELERHLDLFSIFAGMLGEIGLERMRELEAKNSLEQGNEKLLLSNRYNRSIIEASIDAIAVIGPDGSIADVNRAMERVTGRSRGELTGRPAAALCLMDLPRPWSFPLSPGEAEIADYESAVRHADGHVTPVQLNASDYTDEQGRAGGLLLSAHDLTRRKWNEAQISRAEQFRLLADNSTDVIVRLTPEGVCTYASPACMKVLGYSPESVVGQSILHFLHPDDRLKFEHASTTGEASGRQTFVLRFRARHEKGEYRWYEASGQTLLNADGVPTEIQASIRDITEPVQAEEELRKSSREISDLYNHAPCGYHTLDKNGVFLRVNDTELAWLGYTREELIGKKSAGDLMTEKSKETFWAKYPTLIQDGRLRDHELEYRRKDGSVLCVLVSAVSIYDENGGFLMDHATLYDITERKRAEEGLKSAKEYAEEIKERLDIVLKNVDAAVFHLDGRGVYTLAEGRALAKAARPRGRTLGRPVEEVLAGNPAALHAARQALAGKRSSAEYISGETVFEEVFTPCSGADGAHEGVISLAVDITDRKQAEQSLYEEKERLRVTLQSIGDGVIATDAAGRVALMNAAAEEMTGWQQQQALGRFFNDIFDLYNEETGERSTNPVEKVLSTGKTVALGNHTALRAKDGAIRSIADCAAPILDPARGILGVILVFRDVTDAKKKEGEITFLSYHDRLTGLYNRAFLEEEQRRLDTVRQLPISVIMGDVNGLKLTNDVFGHAEGDALLARIAQILRECCRNEDIVARVGGDEFCILLPMTGFAAASDICKRIYARCDKEEYGGPTGSAKLSISLGFATKIGASQSLAEVTKDAEDVMYRRKLLESRSQHSFIISSIRTTLFEKSYETEQHAQRLIVNSKTIAQALNLADDQINEIELFALLHDIGKIAIDSRILTKPGPLDDAEWAEMRRHPEIGFRIAQASPELAHIAECILCHHERWDGAGYPQGLKGTAIPLLARIMLVADAYDAMTQDRVYRKAMSREEACTELLKNAGTQFDPNIVWVFMECLEHGGELA